MFDWKARKRAAPARRRGENVQAAAVARNTENLRLAGPEIGFGCRECGLRWATVAERDRHDLANHHNILGLEVGPPTTSCG